MIDYFRIDGIDFHDFDGLRGNRDLVSIDGLVGLTDPRVTTRNKTERHGGSSYGRWLSARTVTLKGQIWGDDLPGAYSEHRQLTGVLYRTLSEGPKLATWREGNTGLAYQAMVLLAGPMAPPLQEGAALLEYDVMLEQDDPRAYAQNAVTVVGGALSQGGGGLVFPLRFPFRFLGSSGGVAVVTNPGTIETPPIVRVYGPVTSPTYTLVSSGEQVKIDGELAAGDYLEVDHAVRSVKLNGSARRMNLLNASQSQFFDIPGTAEGAVPTPQSIRMYASAFGAGAHLEVTTRAAYLA